MKRQAAPLLEGNKGIEPEPVSAVDMVWVAGDGRRLTVDKMDDRHLINSIRMLERRAGEVKLALNLKQAVAEVASRMFPIHDAMVHELERRLGMAAPTNPRLIISNEGEKLRAINLNR